MKERTKQEEKLLKEFDLLLESQNVYVQIFDPYRDGDKLKSGAYIKNDYVQVVINKDEGIDRLVDLVVDAGVLHDKLLDQRAYKKEHERNNPDFFEALENRIRHAGKNPNYR